MSAALGGTARVLVVQSGFLGDVVLTTPLLGALRERAPRAEVTLLVTPAAAPLMRAHPAVDHVEIDDKRGAGRGPAGLAALARRLRARHFEVAIAAHKSVRTALALRVAGIPRRIGFASAPAARLYTERVARPPALHDRERLLELLRPLEAVPPAGAARRPWVVVGPEAHARATALLDSLGAGPLAGICPGSIWATKRWPARAYGALVRRLEDDGYHCVLLGATEERVLTAAVRSAAGDQGLDLGGATAIDVLAAVLARMAVVVTNDSAPMHLATAVGVPQVAVFCATVPGQGYGPLGERALIVERDLSCRPCGRHGGRRCPRGTDDCMQLIEVAEVHAAVTRARRLAA